MVSDLDAQRLVEAIRSDHLGSSQRTLRSLEGALRAVQKGFSREGHYILEFIQNAEDAGAKALDCTVDIERIVISNDGQPFDSKDIESVCDVGHSKKTPENYIGYLGLGFKSVFLISDEVEIHSGPYHFAFRRDERLSEFPWQIAPIWVDRIEPSPPWSTEFQIRLKDDKLTYKLGNEMVQDSLDRRILLFLESLERLTLTDHAGGLRRTISCVPKGNDIYEIEEDSNGEITRERWLVFSSEPLSVPDYIRSDPFTQNWDRDQASHRAVTIAFKVSDDEILDAVEGTLHMGVFSYLPLREERTRLKFLVHADFLTSIGRTHIQEEAPWNKWLASEVLNFVQEKAVTLLSHKKWRRHAITVLWPQETLTDDFFATEIERPLKEFIQNDLKIPAYDGTLVRATEGLHVTDPDMWEVIGSSDLRRIYEKRPLDQDIQIPLTSLGGQIIHSAPSLFGNSKNPGFVSSSEGQKLLAEKAAAGDLSFFKLLYSKMAERDWESYTYRSAPLAKAAIIVSSDGCVYRPDEVYFKPQNIAGSVEAEFKFVHPELANDEPSRAFLDMVGIEVLPEGEIKDAVLEKVIPDIAERWPHMQPTERRQWLISLKHMVERGNTGMDNLQFVTLPTKTWKWLLPTELLFPDDFSPEWHIETLVGKELLRDASIEFVDSSLGTTEDPLESWKAFLFKLGVGKRATEPAQLNAWSSFVGVQMARQYEVKAGRSQIHEVTEAERGVSDPGYDLKTERIDGSDLRYIEAKATRGPGVFTLRPTTLREMLIGLNKERFFIYVTTNALSSPRLNIIKGDELTREILFEVGEVQLDIRKPAVPITEAIDFDVL